MAQSSEPRLAEREPVAVNNTIMDAIKTFVLAGLALVVGFGWVDWSAEQTGLVVALVSAFFVLLTAVFTVNTRNKVTPVVNPRASDGTPLVPERP